MPSVCMQEHCTKPFASITLNTFVILLCLKLYWHNWLKRTAMCISCTLYNEKGMTMHQHCYAIYFYGKQCQNHIKLIFAKINASLKYLLITTLKFCKIFCNENVITKDFKLYMKIWSMELYGILPLFLPASQLAFYICCFLKVCHDMREL